MTVLAAGSAPRASLQWSCDNAEQFPRNLAPRLGSVSCLQRQHEKLDSDQDRIFRSTRVNVFVTEVSKDDHKSCCGPTANTENDLAGSRDVQHIISGQQATWTQSSPRLQNLSFQDFEGLKGHLSLPLDSGLEDAARRHVFIHALSNRWELLCSSSMFKYMCSYHEVSPKFLNMVHSLGNQLKPDDPQSSHFGGFCEELHMGDCYDDDVQQQPCTTPGDVEDRQCTDEGPLRISSLNRSGKELRNFYQLNAMELGSADRKGRRSWTMRQTTVYHSFDLEFTRQFWVTIKATSNIRERFSERDSKSTSQKQVKNESQELYSAFNESLSAHLIHLDWCVEGWRWYIDEKEIRIREILKKMEASPVAFNHTKSLVRHRSEFEKSQVNFRHGPLSRIGSLVTRASRNTTFDTSQNSPDTTSPRLNSFRQVLSRGSTFDSEKEKTEEQSTEDQPIWYQAAVANIEAKDLTKRFMETEGIFKDFSITGSQDLTALCNGLQDTKLGINSNLRVLEGIRNCYQNFVGSEDCPQTIKDSCQPKLRQFVRRVNSLHTELTGEHCRVESLISQLQDAKPLLESILQFRNLKANEVMAAHSRYASLRMEAVGERTERLTSSMHVITTFTLLLLPGTFLGSIFSTDIIGRGDAGIRVDSVLLALFLKICLPMMVLSLIAWAFYMFLKHRRSQSRREDMLLIEEGLQDEKQAALTQ